MNNNVKISVIVPVFKVEQYLDRCIQSLISQTLRDIEIILVDDGSPDCCPEMCDSYAQMDKRIIVIHKKNEGLGMARNSGLEVAKGEYVAFVDSDDFVSSYMYESLYKETESIKYDIVYCGYYDSWKEGGRLNPKCLLDDEVFASDVGMALADLTAAKWSDPRPIYRTMSVWCCIIRRDIIKQNAVSFKSERELLSEDYIFDYDLYPHVKSIRYIPKALYYYCINGQSLSRIFQANKITRLDNMIHYMLRNKLVKDVDFLQERIIKLFIYYSVLMYWHVFGSSFSLSEKRRLCNLIYNKTMWTTIATQYSIYKLPKNLRTTVILIIHKCFFLSYLLFLKNKLSKKLK